MNWRWLVAGLVAVAGLAIFWWPLFDPDRQLVTQKYQPVRFVRDSPEVRSLIKDAASREVERRKLGTFEETQEQNNFVDGMANRPRIEIPAGSYCRIIERSEAVCGKKPGYGGSFVLVRVTRGAAKGQIGWGCWAGDVFGVNAMP
jgi:hypothetical protein